MNRLLLILFYFLVVHGLHSQPINKKIAASIGKIMEEASEAHQPADYLIRNTNVLTMIDGPELRTGQDVLIQAGKIVSMGSGIDNSDATIIDGSGKYLMPGLTDMHVHMFEFFRTQDTWMLLFLINGVTTVRDMDGEPGKINLRDDISKNRILGPNLYQSGKIVNGREAPSIAFAGTEEDGRRIVKEHKATGYDFIKVYDHLSAEVYNAIIEEAAVQQIPVVGHVPDAVNLSEALGRQHSIEHLTGFIEWAGPKLLLTAGDDYGKKTSASGTWICPTLSTHITNWSLDELENMRADQALLEYLPPSYRKKRSAILGDEDPKKYELVGNYGPANISMIHSIFMDLHNSGAGIVSGTDCGSIIIVPGFSLHEELRMMREAGMPLFDVLKTTTINAAKALGKADEFGTVEVGKRADLLLLEANPLDSIENLKTIQGVMVRGTWLPEADLENISSRIRQTFKK